MKNKETLEEAAYLMLCDYGTKSIAESINVLQVKRLMVKMAKWQQEQNKNLYSEEEVLEIIDSLFHQYASSFRIDAKEYFLQFKKK